MRFVGLVLLDMLEPPAFRSSVVRSGLEPPPTTYQIAMLPLHHRTTNHSLQSGRSDSNRHARAPKARGLAVALHPVLLAHFSVSSRVRRRHCCRPLPSEPCVQVSPHTAQAIDSCLPYRINLLGRSEVRRSRSANTRCTCAMSLRLPFHPSLSLARSTTSVNHLSEVSALSGWPHGLSSRL